MESTSSIGLGTERRVTVAMERHLWKLLGEYERKMVGKWMGVVFVDEGEKWVMRL